jgi:hypothetical protein
VISSSQKYLSDNTQHSQQTDIHAPVGFEPATSANEQQQTYALARTAARINGGSAEFKNIGSGKEKTYTFHL